MEATADLESICQECLGKQGRLLDLCECRGHEGRVDPRLEDCDFWRAEWGMKPISTMELAHIRNRPPSLPSSRIGGRNCCGGNRQSSPDASVPASLSTENQSADMPVAQSTESTLSGPGFELLQIFKSKGMPHCQACQDLSEKMNAWGVDGCRSRMTEIVNDILPRAKAWMAGNHPWIHAWIPAAIEDAMLKSRIYRSVGDAIVAAQKRELSLRENGRSRSNWRKIQKAGHGLQHGLNHRLYRGLVNNVPLIGIPIDRSRLVSHILFHIMPLAGETEWVWRRHCQWLREVRPQYNGRLIVGIVTAGIDDHWKYCNPGEVHEALAGLDAEFVESPNHVARSGRSGIGEGVLFPRMLGKLETDDPDQVAFYGHAKGVSRPGYASDSAPHKWAEAMWETLFRNQSAAIDALDSKGICGPFCMRGRHPVGVPGVGPNWFYSGTYFAARLADVFRRDWKLLTSHYGCVEQWPRMNFALDEQSACLFFDGVNNLYSDVYWEKEVTPALQKWRENRGSSRTTAVLPETGREIPSLVLQ